MGAAAEAVLAELESLARIAVEQVQLPVLEWLQKNQHVDVANWHYENGSTLLHAAAGAGAPRVAEWLLQHGADADARDDTGTTAAHWVAVGKGNTGSLSRAPDTLAVLHAARAD